MTREINNLRSLITVCPVRIVALMAEVMRSVPALMEVESFEYDLTDAHIALETDSLHRSGWETMMEVSQLKGNY